MAKKEAVKLIKQTELKSNDNSYGISAVILGILGVSLTLNLPLTGLILGIISVVFGNKQKKRAKNSWSKAGIILGWIAIVLSVIIIIMMVLALKTLLQDPNFISQLPGGY